MSPSGFVNTSNTNTANSGQRSSGSQPFFPNVPGVNIMAGNNIKLPIFNGNGLEDPEKHSFLCESIWSVQQVQYEVKKQVKMITTMRGYALDWYIKLSIVPAGVAQKTLNQI